MRRLQNARSVYDCRQWERESRSSHFRAQMLQRNSGRYTKHPYFVPQARFRDPLRVNNKNVR